MNTERHAGITRAITVATRHGIPADTLALHLHGTPTRVRLRVATGLAIDAALCAAAGAPVADLPHIRAAYWTGIHLQPVHRDHPAVHVAERAGEWDLIAGRCTRADLDTHPDLELVLAHSPRGRALYPYAPVELRQHSLDRLRLTLTTHARAIPAVADARPTGATRTRRHLRVA